jgi:hypothetical protein
MALGGVTGTDYSALSASQAASLSAAQQSRNVTGSNTESATGTSSSQALVGRSVSSLIASDSFGVLIKTQEKDQLSTPQAQERLRAEAQKAGQELTKAIAQRVQNTAELRAALQRDDKVATTEEQAVRKEAQKAEILAAVQRAEAVVAEKVALRKELTDEAYLKREQRAIELARTNRKAAIADEQERRSLRKEQAQSA